MRIQFIILFISLCISSHAQLNLELLAHVPNDSGVTLAGCWHYTDAQSNQYALIGTRNGVDIYDVTVPTQPVRKFQVPGVVSNWRELKTWSHYAYISSEGAGSGITIVNLGYLPDSIQWKVWTGNDSLTNKIQKSHAIGAEDGYLYIYGSTTPNHGAIICDLSDPWNPDFEGQYQLNYIHDGFVRGDTLWGSEIYKGQFSVINIADKTNPVLIATQTTPGAFNHNSGLSKDSRFLFTTDEKPSTPLGAFDVTDLENITLTDRYYPSQKPSAEVHNVRVTDDNYLVCPSYSGQLTIVDASDPYNLIEIAWANLGASLVWDADPYLPSGIIYATAKNEGLFIFKPNYQRASRLAGTVTDAVSGLPVPGAKVFVIGTPNADTTGLEGKYATGAALPGSYSLMAAANGYDTLIINNIALIAGETVIRNIQLNPAFVSTDAAGIRSGFVAVYPTVVRDGFNLAFENMQFNTPVQLVNATGEVVEQKNISGAGTFWSTNGLAAGVYWVKIDGVSAGKIVVR